MRDESGKEARTLDFQSILTQMLLLFFMLALGYLVAKLGIMSKNATKDISNLVICVTNPCSVLFSVLGTEHVLSNPQVFELTGFSVCVFGFFILVAVFVPKLLRVTEDAGLYRFMTVMPNAGFIGFPVVRAVFGPNAVFYASVHNLVLQIVLYTYGLRQISKRPEDRKISWRTFCQPIVVAAILGYIFYLTDFRAPAFAVSALGLVDQMTTPLATLVIGYALASIPLKKTFCTWRLYPMIALRQLFVPVCCFLLLRLVVSNELILGVLVIMSMMPIANMTTMFCAKYGGNESLAAGGVFLSTAFSVIGIPFLMRLLFGV